MPNIFGVEIKERDKKSFYAEIEKRLTVGNEPLFIVTLNPEIALFAKKDPEYVKLINRACPVIDGFGIQLVMKLKGQQPGERITGAEICDLLFRLGAKLGKRVMVIARKDGLSKISLIEKAISKRYPKIDFNIIDERVFCKNKNKYIDAEILVVSLGAPKQERFIAENLEDFLKLKIAIGIGGTFDYWTGKKPRAPKLARKLGLEWLWRLILQPKRIRRIINAVVIFPFKALTEKNGKN